MALTLDQFSTEISNTTSTGLLLAGNLAFTANRWEVDNGGTIPLRLTLASTTPSTDGYEVKPGESRAFVGATSKFALSTTSSSTEDHRRARVLALAG